MTNITARPVTVHATRFPHLARFALVAALAVAALASLSGCAGMAEQARQQQIAQNERDCNPGSTCYNSLTPEQKLKLVAIKQEAAQQEKNRQLTYHFLNLLQTRASFK
ncbi:MAG: hypothetical protein HYX42_18430 [Polaromonas sp.]|uniref:hypothetical protein n=1 Tax=Polaromonas sp. TaxID=1869339 RepID=UPI0025EDD181|nr:hypothetical protein [Polaromonas sp.]MBI2728220.1 hypothetical protein [Polaromonas sp.]